MEKATKEAKKRTSWINPNVEYDDAVRKFVQTALAPSISANRIPTKVDRLAQRLAYFGRFNSLSQVVFKLMSPGVPDIYQGNELWDYSLVDPDNRRLVDYPTRLRMLEELRPALDGKAADLPAFIAELLANAADGRIKLYLTARLLRLRTQRLALFRQGK